MKAFDFACIIILVVGAVFGISINIQNAQTAIIQDNAAHRDNITFAKGYIIDVPEEMPYDGNYYAHKMGNIITIEPVTVKDYSISWTTNDSIQIWDNDVLLSTIPASHSLIDSVLNKLNE